MHAKCRSVSYSRLPLASCQESRQHLYSVAGHIYMQLGLITCASQRATILCILSGQSVYVITQHQASILQLYYAACLFTEILKTSVRKNCCVVPVCRHMLGKQQIQITSFHKLTKSCCFTRTQLDTTAAPVIHHANILHTWHLDTINCGIGRHHSF